ncbi:DUF4134 domain-containing protein [Mucilaginibacter sp. KACC 22063]|uniref:DUF4134 domain-containing protein n=1 Tax=Mucilaginibacter sp. KACC 22063 TaxID=3025666 RepID=UPI002366CE91|nr:DUF4134 domain-containing protein [Mucilaginibacter sp. KACC 22063]WDF55878.1 DUF4134 domain-containing protein [Mucilaginibacter sp. KACC 22063]
MKKLLAFVLLLPAAAFAQPGITEMQEARSDLTQSFFSARDLSLVVAAILGIIGAVRIYHNLQMGRERFTAEVTAWFFSALFMVLLGAFLQAVFGI